MAADLAAVLLWDDELELVATVIQTPLRLDTGSSSMIHS
jgi:hypothetical protein